MEGEGRSKGRLMRRQFHCTRRVAHRFVRLSPERFVPVDKFESDQLKTLVKMESNKPVVLRGHHSSPWLLPTSPRALVLPTQIPAHNPLFFSSLQASFDYRCSLPIPTLYRDSTSKIQTKLGGPRCSCFECARRERIARRVLVPPWSSQQAGYHGSGWF